MKIATPQSAAGHRTIDLPAVALASLKRWRREQAACGSDSMTCDTRRPRLSSRRASNRGYSKTCLDTPTFG